MPSKPDITDVIYLQEIVDAIAGGTSQVQLAERYGIARQTLQSHLRIATKGGIIPTPVDFEGERKRYERRIRDLGQEIDSIRQENLTSRTIRQEIFKIASRSPEPPSWLLSPPKEPRGSPGAPLALLSDLHWGEVVRPEQIDGLNEYNLKVARKRLRNWTSKLVDLCFNHTRDPNYPGLVLCLGGDMISGDIHKELEITNEEPTIKTVFDLCDHLITAIDHLVGVFGRIHIFGVTGNHGRNTLKPMFKNRNWTSFDWLLYIMLERHYAEEDRITFTIPEGSDAYFSLMNHRFLLTHGDMLGVRGGDGIIGSLGPIIRGDWKVRAASESVGKSYDTILMGHWHQYISLQKIVVNGSLKGFDEFAKGALRARPEAPIQALLFVHPDHGIIDQRPVFCGEVSQVRSKAAWLAVRE